MDDRIQQALDADREQREHIEQRARRCECNSNNYPPPCVPCDYAALAELGMQDRAHHAGLLAEVLHRKLCWEQNVAHCTDCSHTTPKLCPGHSERGRIIEARVLSELTAWADAVLGAPR